MDELKKTPNLYFFSRKDLLASFYKQKQALENEMLSTLNTSSSEADETSLLGGLVQISKNDDIGAEQDESALAPFINIDQLLAKEDFSAIIEYIASIDEQYSYKKWLINWSQELSEKQAFLKRLSQLESHILKNLSN